MNKMLYEVSAGEPKRLIKPVITTTIAELVNFLPIVFIFWIIYLILEAFLNDHPINKSLVIGISIFLIAFLVVMFVFEVISYRALYRGAYELSAKGRISLAEHLAKLPLGYLDSKDPGSLAFALMSHYTNVETALSHKIPIYIANTIVPIVVFIGLLMINWQMAIAAIICLPISLLCIYFSQGILDSLSVKQQQANLDVANRLQEYLSGIAVIKAYNLVGERFKRLVDSFEYLRKASIALEITLSPFVMLTLTFVGAGLGIMIVTGRYLIFTGALDIFTFIAFLMIGTKAFVPFTTSVIAFLETKYYQKSGQKILEIKNQKPLGGVNLTPNDYEIEFKGVSFAYHDKSVLKNISIIIPKNNFIAITGPSGGGKSTILKLIARFYEVNSGSINFGGQDIKNLEPESYMQKISMVFQSVYLFSDTIANNITLGKQNASAQQIEEVCKKANCHEFISKMPEGLNTLVTNGGNSLSGGQKQRISIARALLKDAPIVLLDEFSAALDALNEQKIQQALSELVKDKTLVVVAHKLKTITNADKIYYLDEGEIKEEGNHNQLLGLGGEYAKMWKLQNE